MKYVPYHELGDRPNIIVDGAANSFTKLALSHWPHSGTPRELQADLSAEIVFRYLERPDLQLEIDAVSNNHFDEDGLICLYTMLNPDAAKAKRELLVDIAAAGDFGTYRFREAARTAFVIASMSEASTSSLPPEIFRKPYSETTAALYSELLKMLPDIIEHPEKYKQYWEDEEQDLEQSEIDIQNGKIGIQEFPEIDLAVVTIPEGAQCHALALHNATKRFRILKMTGRSYELKFRYETWVQLVSSKPMQRVDLMPLAAQLTKLDSGEWEFDGVDDIIPRLGRSDSDASKILPEAFIEVVRNFLKSAPPAWNPFDPA